MTQQVKAEAAAAEPAAGDIAGALHRQIEALRLAERRGDLAALRRMDPDHPDAPAFFRIVARVNAAASAPELVTLAHAARLLAHRPEALASGSLGGALHAAKVSEGRVQRLLAARSDALRAQVVMLARRLAREGALPWRPLIDLILLPDESEAAERLRLRIARDYWTAADRNPSEAAEQTKSP